MSRNAKPFNTPRRTDSKTYQITLNISCGLSDRICKEWYRRSFQDLPEELAQYCSPKTKATAQAGAFALIEYLKKKQEEGNIQRFTTEDITVGAWIKKFTEMETSPRTGINASRNSPYSYNTLDAYKCYFNCHIKDDLIASLKMAKVEQEDILEYVTRLSVKKFKIIKDGKEIEGKK